MTYTRIAGTAYDAREKNQLEQLARIHGYAVRIRHIAKKAARALPIVQLTSVADAPGDGRRSKRQPATLAQRPTSLPHNLPMNG